MANNSDLINEGLLNEYHDELMKTHLVGGVVFDISAYKASGTPPVLAKFANLTDALGTNGANVPVSMRKGGMSVKYVQSSDNNYVQFRCMAQNFTTDVTQWQGVDEEPIRKSKNLVESGGVDKKKLNKKYRYYISSNTITDAYEDGLADLFIDNTLFPITNLSLNYVVVGTNQTLRISYKSSTQTSWTTLEEFAISDIINNEINNLTYNDNVIGYLVISDKQKFIDNPTFTGYELDVDIVTSKRLHYRKYWEKIDSFDIKDNAIIPSKIPDGSIGISKLNKRYFKTTNAITSEYEKGLKYIYINKSVLPIQDAYIQCNNSLLYIYYKGIPNTGWKPLVNGVAFSTITNNAPLNLTVDGNVVGFVTFSDKQKFIDNPTTNPPHLIIDKITSKWEQELVDGENIEKDSIGTTHIQSKSVTYEKTNFTFYKKISELTNSYNEGLQDIYINKTLFTVTNIGLKAYTIGGISRLYCYFKTETITTWTELFVTELASLENNTIVNIIYNGNTVGYYVLSDKQKFVENSDAGIPELNIEAVTSKKDIYHSRGFFNDFATKADIKQYCSKNIVINLPATIYAIVGTEMNLWNDAISYSLDNGRNSPTNYKVYWQSSVGLITNRGYRFTPTTEQAGSQYAITCRIYDVFGNVITSKNITIKVLAKNALSSAKNIIFFGDSTGAETANIIYDDFHNTNKYDGTIPNMLGTIGNAAKYEADGGRTWKYYVTRGVAQFRCFISSDAPTIPLNATYTNNGYTWTVKEVNITEGAGNILITKNDTNYNEHPTNGGTLVSTQSGRSDIVFDSYVNTPSNPLWDETLNDGAGGLSIDKYKTNLGVEQTTKFDAVAFFLGLNSNTEVGDTLVGYIKTLYNLFINDNPNCKFIIGTISASNTEYGWGINYGASIPSMYSKEVYFEKNKLYLSLLNDSDLPNLRICPAGSEIDRYYGYMFENRPISQRYTTNESVHSNAVHPAISGYGQFGDAFFANYIGVLTE